MPDSVSASFASNADDAFSYEVGMVEGRAGKDFNKVFDPELYKNRLAFLHGFQAGVAMAVASNAVKVKTPELVEVWGD